MMVNATGCIVNSMTAVLFAGASVYNLIHTDMVPALVFLLLFIPFLHAAIRDGRVVKTDKEGVRLYKLGRLAASCPWSSIREVGVVGVRLFLPARRKGPAQARYIYFSSAPLTEDDRFQMCLQWPPKNRIYMRYSYDRLSSVQSLWSQKIHIYNAGDIEI